MATHGDADREVLDRVDSALLRAIKGAIWFPLVDLPRRIQTSSLLVVRLLRIGVLLIVVAVFYAINVARGGVGAAEEGEDNDLTTPIDAKTVALLIGVFIANALLIEPLGWVISGSLLFWGSAFALGNRHHIRGLAIGVALALVTFYAFAIGLGVNLPAGILQGIL